MSSPISNSFRTIAPAVLAFCCATGVSANAVEAAGKYRAGGELTAAVIELKSALQRNTDDADARALLGDIYLDLGDGAAAEKELRQAAALGRQDLSPLIARSLLRQQAYGRLLEEVQVPDEAPPADRALLFALRGDAHAALDDSDAAADAYARALELVPEQPDARLGEARLAMQRETPERVKPFVQRALEAAPESAEAWMLQARLALQDNDTDAAESAFAKAIEHAPVDFDYRVARALSRIDRGDYDGAQADVDALRVQHDGQPAVAFLQGRIAFHTGRYDAAYEHFQRARGVPAFEPTVPFYLGASALATGAHEQALELLGRFAGANPDNTTAGRLLAQARAASGDTAGARALLDDLLRASPDDTPALQVAARIAESAGDAEAAAGYRRRLAELAPDDATATADLGLSLIRGDDDAVAAGLDALEAALAADPKLFIADVGTISALLRQGRNEDALAAARAMAEKYPANGAPRALAGIARGALGDLAGAASEFERALELTPGEPATSVNLARLALAAGEPDRARDYLQRSLQHFPDHPRTMLSLARVEARHGSDAAGRKLIERAIAAHPAKLGPYLALVGFERARGGAQQGLEQLLNARPMFEQDPDYWSIVGLLQLADGDAQAAVVSIGRRIQLTPDSADAYLQLANAQIAAGDETAFERPLLEALGLRADHPDAGPLVHYYLDRAGSDEEQTRRMARLRSIAPQRPELALREAMQAREERRYPLAESLYRQGMEQFPADTRFVLGLAQLQIARDKPDEAITVIEARLRERPGDALLLDILAELRLMQGRADAARAALEQAVASAPGNARLRNNLAWVLRDEAPIEALAQAERAVALSGGKEPAYLDTLGQILLANGDAVAAQKALSNAIAIDPTNPSFKYQYARALKVGGNVEQARRLLLEVLADKRSFPERELAEAMANQLR